jgi:hypothetical protein
MKEAASVGGPFHGFDPDHLNPNRLEFPSSSSFFAFLKEAAMWVLIVVFLQTGSAFTVPGYSSQEKCSAAGKQVLQDIILQGLKPASPQLGAVVTFLCEHPD